LFVLSIFGVIASHVSTGLLSRFASDLAPMGVAYLDRYLERFLVGPLGTEISIYVILGIGAFFALWAYMAGRASQETGRTERFSTW
jgi:hypothetical protein